MSDIIACNDLKVLSEHLQKLASKDRAILCDTNTKKHCLPLLADYMDVNIDRIICIPPGEQSKSLTTAESIWSTMLQMNLSRKSTLICLGGGVVTDIGGFCAATYKRGISFVHVPTSLLAMVDAAIGGKTGINLHSYKNMLGSFSYPEAVLIHPGFLKTLPADELLNGRAEVIKHSLILDADQWHKYLALAKLTLPADEEIFRSANIKKTAIQKDPKETGYRKILNFGHTIGHALESLYADKKQPLSHGLAVAAGMLMEAQICMAQGYLSKPDFIQIARFLGLQFPKITFANSDFPKILTAMQVDKKSEGGAIFIAGLKAPGTAIPAIPVHADDVIIALEYYMDFAL